MTTDVLTPSSGPIGMGAAPSIAAVLLAHPHALLREGLAMALAVHGPVHRSAWGRTPPAVAASGTGLVVTDRAGAMDADAVRALAAPVLVVDFGMCGREVRRLLDAGVRGCVHADCDLQELAHAVEVLLAGGQHLCRRCAAALADDVMLVGFTPREEEVLALICQGLDNKRIAQRLGLALSTVKTHVRALLTKTGANNRTNIATSILRRGAS